ncbi:MAG: phosphotransferase family protein [Pseudomonadota bacterium]
MDDHDLEKGPLHNAQQLTGGTQNILIRFKRGQREFVFRRPPQHVRSNSNEIMRRETRVLAALANTRVPHPNLIAACLDENVLGAVFYLMESVDGFNPIEGLPETHVENPSIRHRMGVSMIEALSELSGIDYQKAGLEGFGHTENYLERQVERWSQHLLSYNNVQEWYGDTDFAELSMVREWLATNTPKDFTPGLIHGDYHLGNVIFPRDSGDVSAIVDWELSTIGDPLLDLGWLLATWPEGVEIQPEDVGVNPFTGFPSHAELIEAYSKLAARPIDHLNWYAVLACYKMAIIVEGTNARACAGKAPREVGDRLHDKAIGLFARAGRWVENPIH